MDLSLSVIIPAYNEEARLGDTLRTTFAYLNDYVPLSEVIVVDDGSTDRTIAVAEESFADAGKVQPSVIAVKPNRGKGYAVRQGLLAARAPVALFSDADLSTPITELPKLTAPIRSGDYDVVFGSRALDRRLIGTRQPWRREQGGKAVNLLVRLRTGLPFWDTQCGFKAFRMAVFRPLAEAARIERFGFDIELLYLAHKAGLRMLERPVRWNHNDGSKLDPMRDGWRMLTEIEQIRRHAQVRTYDDAIAQARALLALDTNRQPFATRDDGTPVKSDVPPELAHPAARI